MNVAVTTVLQCYREGNHFLVMAGIVLISNILILHFIKLVYEASLLEGSTRLARKRYKYFLSHSHTDAKAHALRVHYRVESARRGGPAASVSVIAFFLLPSVK